MKKFRGKTDRKTKALQNINMRCNIQRAWNTEYSIRIEIKTTHEYMCISVLYVGCMAIVMGDGVCTNVHFVNVSQFN